MMLSIRRLLGLFTFLVVAILLLPSLSSAQVVSNDPTLTPSVLKAGLSTPSGVVSRPTTGDLVVSQNGANLVSLVDAASGATKTFVTQPSANEVAISSGGVVAVNTQPGGPIDFYSSSGMLLGSIAAGIPNGCIGGLTFDSNGNLFVAAGQMVEGCSLTGWNLYEFAGPTPWTSESFLLDTDGTFNQIEGLVFSPATPAGSPAGSGAFYAVSPTSRFVYQFALCADCEGTQYDFTTFAQVPLNNDDSNPNPSGIAVDPLLGNIYITERTGTAVLTFPPPSEFAECCETPTTFATGFSNTFGLTFDTNGNLYVNETNAGNVWKFTRAAFPTPPQQIVQGQPQTFTNPNKSMSDQIFTLTIPKSAGLCDTNGHCAAFIEAIFVPVDQNILNQRLAPGSLGDEDFFGGGPVTALSKCVPVPSASPDPTHPTNCLVTIQKCFDLNHVPFDICPIREPLISPDLILLTSSFSPMSAPLPGPASFAIDFDAPTSDQTVTDITISPLDCCSGGGGSKGLCSGTFFYIPGASTNPDFSVGPISTSPIPISAGGSGSTSVPVTSINSFASPVTLSVADAPPGVTTSFGTNPVTPTGASTLTVSVGPTFGSATTTTDITTVIANLASSGCIDPGTANALTSKLSAAQADIGGGKIQTALNVLGAFKSQVQAESGKHISTSCTATFTLAVEGKASALMHLARADANVTGTNAASILLADVATLMGTLSNVTSPDPITGFVFQGGLPVTGTTVSLLDSTSALVGINMNPTMTDPTGFYYFANTGGLIKGANYTVQVGATSQTFTWLGKGLAINLTLP